MKRSALIAVVAAGLALSACDEPSNGGNEARSNRAPQPEMLMMADAAAPRSAVSAMSAKSGPRMEIGRSYAIEIIDGEVSAAMEADRAQCLKLECVVTAVNTTKATYTGRPTATLTALVPQARATQFHEHLMSAPDRDITAFNETAHNREEQHQNIKARLERLEFMRKRLYGLADKKSDKVGELLQVERELLRVDTEIERLTRERKGVEKVTDNISFTITYTQRPPKAGDIDFSPFAGLLSDTLNTFLQAVRTTALWIARWLPAIALVGIVLVALKRRRDR